MIALDKLEQTLAFLELLVGAKKALACSQKSLLYIIAVDSYDGKIRLSELRVKNLSVKLLLAL